MSALERLLDDLLTSDEEDGEVHDTQAEATPANIDAVSALANGASGESQKGNTQGSLSTACTQLKRGDNLPRTPGTSEPHSFLPSASGVSSGKSIAHVTAHEGQSWLHGPLASQQTLGDSSATYNKPLSAAAVADSSQSPGRIESRPAELPATGTPPAQALIESTDQPGLTSVSSYQPDHTISHEVDVHEASISNSLEDIGRPESSGRHVKDALQVSTSLSRAAVSPRLTPDLAKSPSSTSSFDRNKQLGRGEPAAFQEGGRAEAQPSFPESAEEVAQGLISEPEIGTDALTSAAYEEGHNDDLDGLSVSDLALDQDESAYNQPSGPRGASGLPGQMSVAESKAEAGGSAAEGLHEEVSKMSASEAVLARAEAEERALATGKGIKGLANEEAVPTDPLDSLRLRLQWAKEEWSPDGHPDSRGGLLGGQLLMRAELVGALEEAMSNHKAAGDKRCVAVFRGVFALGMSSSVIFVLMPRGVGADGQPKGQAEVLQLGHARGQEDSAVTCLAFSPQGSLLVAGHADGDVNFWEFRRTSWECIKSIKDAHVTQVVQATFLEGQQLTAVTSDSRGRLIFHNVSSYLSLTAMFAGRLAKGAQPAVLHDGRQLGPLCLLCCLPAPKTAPNQATDLGRAAFLPEGVASPCDSTLLMCSAKGAFVGKVTPEGKLVVLHTLPRPPDAREACLPYAAWHLLPMDPASRHASAHLAMGWDRTAFLFEVPIQLPQPGAAGPGENPPERAQVCLLHRWEVEQPIVALHWLDGPSLAVACQQGPHFHLSLYNAEGDVRREHLALGDPLVGHSHLMDQHGQAEAYFHPATASTSGGLLLLSSQGVRIARLLNWQERLSALRDISQWELALLVGLDILQTAQASSSATTHEDVQRVWRGEGRGADPQQVGDILVVLLTGYLGATLPEAAESDNMASQMQAAAAADVAIDLCVALQRRSVLWTIVVPRFATAGCLPVLLEHLLRPILSDQLPALAPEVMQALVEYCAGEGKPEAVEAAVMHMDIASLDLNQVIRLCRQHGLFSALAFLYPRALLDFVAAAAELLVALVHAPAAASAPNRGAGGMQQALADKLLVYLRCCFRGHSFPPGSGDLESSQVWETKAQLLGFLLYGRPTFIERLLHAFGAEDSNAAEANLTALLPGPHPVLRQLVTLDAGAVLLILHEVLVNLDLPDSALRAAANVPGSQTDTLAEQAILDAVVALLDAGAFRERGDDESAGVGVSRSEGGTYLALAWVADVVAEGRVTANAAVIMRLLQWLALGPWRAGRPPPFHHRQQHFIALLHHLDLRPAASKAGWEASRVQALAQQAGFLQAEAQVHHMAGNYAAALDRLLHTSHQAAFDYLGTALDSPRTSPKEAGLIWAAIKGALVSLVEADGAAVAALVLSRFPHEHTNVLSELRASPELQFWYLKGAMELSRELDNEGLGDTHGLQLAAPSEAGVGGQLAEAQASELYIRLLCQFEPSAVLPFLQSHEAYRVQEVLPHCQEHGVLDAQAFLLERLGDVAAALKIYAQRLHSTTSTLVDAILRGAIAPEQLLAHGPGKAAYLGAHRAGLGFRRAQGTLAPEVSEAYSALKAAVALCQRHSRDTLPQVAQQLWLGVLRCYVVLLRDLRSRPGAASPAPKPSLQQKAPAKLAWPTGGDSKAQLVSMGEVAAAERRDSQTIVDSDPVAVAQRLLMGCMEDVIAEMAGYVPLSAIGERILAEFADDCFGDFRGSLVGLLAAYNYELSILQAANRLMSSDAFRILYSVYRSHRQPAAAEAVQAHQHSLAGCSFDDASSTYTSTASMQQSPAKSTSSWAQAALSKGEWSAAAAGTHAYRSGQGPTLGTNVRISGGGRQQQPLPLSPMFRSGVDIDFLRSYQTNV